MEYVLLGALVVFIVLAVSVTGARGEVGLSAVYARIWGRLSGRRVRH
ncbi:MAG TPA: hypothetical protein VF001_02615 [Candidatus Limnocylindria bacterium]